MHLLGKLTPVSHACLPVGEIDDAGCCVPVCFSHMPRSALVNLQLGHMGADSPWSLGRKPAEPAVHCSSGIAGRAAELGPPGTGKITPHRLRFVTAGVRQMLQGLGFPPRPRLLAAVNCRKTLCYVLSQDERKCCDYYYSMQLIKQTAF